MMQSQHLPSPARLGLSSPSHPSNQTPTPPPTNTAPNPTNPKPSTATTTPTPTPSISSSLLPLLPPLPRAQSLLHLMSSLTPKLFDLSPNRSIYLSHYKGSFPSFLSSSASSSSAISAPPVSSTADLLSLFEDLQSQLVESVSELQQILDMQDSQKMHSREARSKDAAALAFAKKLREAHQVLDRLVDDYADYRRDPKRPRSDAPGTSDPDGISGGDYHISLHSSLSLEDVLSYAHRISYTTFAPPEHAAGVPLRGALPPAPQDNEMRMSQLYQFADLDVGVPKKPPLEGREQASDVLAQPLMEPTPPREEQKLPLPVPARLPITVPEGWQKGMPVVLPPIDIPLPPPGWKPGDPIVLPGDGGFLVGGNKGEEQRVAVQPQPAVAQRAVPKAPEPIQVKHVQLDIDEDNSSEYSSGVGSSEEDDED